ncbi:MAG: hypothetical protein AAGI90_04850 [Chlamydiota bacterium]
MQIEKKKQILQKALTLGENYTSEKTRFIQFDERIDLTQEWCFALACCKSKQKDLALTAIKKINRLLHFQNGEGAFPEYLHDYPHAYSTKAGLKIFLCLAQIIAHMKPILQPSTYAPWENACKRLEDCLQKQVKTLIEKRWLACAQHYRQGERGQFFSQKEDLEVYGFSSAAEWGEHYCFLQAAFPSSATALAEIASFYHPRFGYMGPMNGEKEREGKRLFTHMDLFFRPSLEGVEDPLCLEGALLISLPEIPKRRESYKDWKIQETKEHVRLTSLDALHVIGEKSRFFFSEKGCRFLGDQATFPVVVSDPKLPFVAKAFWNYAKETQVHVNGKRSSLFRLGDVISIVSSAFSIEMVWKLASGSGDFTGHLLRGSRPQELAPEGRRDSMLAIRSLRHQPETTLLVSFKIQ